MSWADVYAALPARFQCTTNPGRLLETLLADSTLLKAYLFASFLPRRFYGGFTRYPGQRKFIQEWLIQRDAKPVRCLDGACGTGEECYGLAGLAMSCGYAKGSLHIEGWTVEPLEVWAARHRRFPHDRQRELCFRDVTDHLFEHGYHRSISFSCRDLLDMHASRLDTCENRDRNGDLYDLILCNGLLGGPLLHESQQLERVVHYLADRLAPGGMLLAADSFHGGWKQQCPQQKLRALFEKNRLKTFEAGEGVGGLKPDQ
jgi:chemotaxis methyl-accepting protein methylase